MVTEGLLRALLRALSLKVFACVWKFFRLMKKKHISLPLNTVSTNILVTEKTETSVALSDCSKKLSFFGISILIHNYFQFRNWYNTSINKWKFLQHNTLKILGLLISNIKCMPFYDKLWSDLSLIWKYALIFPAHLWKTNSNIRFTPYEH